MDVLSYGAIALNTISLNANGNSGVGSPCPTAPIPNTNCPGSGNGAYLDNYYSATGKTITLSGVSFFDGNHDIGLAAFSKGAISASNVTANDNANEWGVELDNTIGAASITLFGTNVFNGNGHDGLTVSSNGAITLSSVTANNDGQSHVANVFGVWLDNSGGTNQMVMLTGVNIFNGDYSGGIYVNSKGAIKLTNVTANDSIVGPGATLLNDIGKSGITLTGFSMFNNNAGDGADINSSGTITLTKITADNNVGDGLSIDNGAPSYLPAYTYSGKPNNVVITCGSFVDNTGFGVNAKLASGKTLKLVGGVLFNNSGGDIPQVGSGYLISVNQVCP